MSLFKCKNKMEEGSITQSISSTEMTIVRKALLFYPTDSILRLDKTFSGMLKWCKKGIIHIFIGWNSHDSFMKDIIKAHPKERNSKLSTNWKSELKGNCHFKAWLLDFSSNLNKLSKYNRGSIKTFVSLEYFNLNLWPYVQLSNM